MRFANEIYSKYYPKMSIKLCGCIEDCSRICENCGKEEGEWGLFRKEKEDGTEINVCDECSIAISVKDACAYKGLYGNIISFFCRIFILYLLFLFVMICISVIFLFFVWGIDTSFTYLCVYALISMIAFLFFCEV